MAESGLTSPDLRCLHPCYSHRENSFGRHLVVQEDARHDVLPCVDTDRVADVIEWDKDVLGVVRAREGHDRHLEEFGDDSNLIFSRGTLE